MKIAHLLFGMSNTSHYVYWRKKHGYHPIITINYKDTFSNQKDMLLKCFTGSEVDIFFSTYDNKKKNKIIKHYNPKKYIFIDKYIPNGTIARNTHFTNALKLCIDYSEKNNVKYDFDDAMWLSMLKCASYRVFVDKVEHTVAFFYPFFPMPFILQVSIH